MATLSSILAWRIPMDREAWRAIVHRVAKSQTRLSDYAQHKDFNTQPQTTQPGSGCPLSTPANRGSKNKLFPLNELSLKRRHSLMGRGIQKEPEFPCSTCFYYLCLFTEKGKKPIFVRRFQHSLWSARVEVARSLGFHVLRGSDPSYEAQLLENPDQSGFWKCV